MLESTNQTKSNVTGDQIGRDQTNIYQMLEVKKELAVARKVIADSNIGLDDFVKVEVDDDNTILIQKLKAGGFNSLARNNAKMQKVRTISNIITMSKKESGKIILGEIYCNLMSVINARYIVHMKEGETLRTSFKEILEDLSSVVNKYIDIMPVDEAFLEGLLYVATSNCALKWLIEEDDDEDPANCK